MHASCAQLRWLAVLALTAGFATQAIAQDKPIRFGLTCPTPPALHCPDNECASSLVINQGPIVEMKTRRPYFLDYPCELKQGEKVTFILSLHGGGSYGNWQRHYFPIMDYKDKYRLVMPPFALITYPGRLLPIPVFDKLAEFFGINSSMDDFTGRKGK